MTVRWVWAFLDLPEPGFEDGLAFWAAVARSTPSARRGEHGEFTTLLPARGDAWLKVQRVGGAGGVHVDLDVDVPAARWDVEVAFWSALTGWERTGRGCGCSGDDGSDAENEFGRFTWPEGLPVRFLHQHLDEPDGAVRAHVDLAATEPEREVERHVALGAARVQDGRGWVVLRAASGALYCVTDRHPARELQT